MNDPKLKSWIQNDRTRLLLQNVQTPLGNLDQVKIGVMMLTRKKFTSGILFKDRSLIVEDIFGFTAHFWFAIWIYLNALSPVFANNIENHWQTFTETFSIREYHKSYFGWVDEVVTKLHLLRTI